MGTAHVWVWRVAADGLVEVLLQKRSMSKTIHPGMYDISAAGHVAKGEFPLKATQREALEEICLELLFAFSLRKTNPGAGHVIARVSADFEPCHKEGEVDSTVWVSWRDSEALCHDPEGNNLANHGLGYFTLLRE